MKKITIAMIIAALFLVGGQSVQAETATYDISFINAFDESLQGVDGKTKSWSTGDSTVDLGRRRWSLLNDTAYVKAIGGADLSHRGTRGLGVFSGESDEIDNYDGRSRIEVVFNAPVLLNSFEVRSLFREPYGDGMVNEKALAKFFLNDSLVGIEKMKAVETIGNGNLGVADYLYETPFLVDRLLFFVPEGKDYAAYSEFALAKISISAVPEPVSSALFLLGGASIALFRRKKKK